ncbi:MAG: hypothetical protein ACSLFF_11000 [Solirubrobacterales bacterium]
MPQTHIDADRYVVDAPRVAEALLVRINKLADERARFRRALIYSVEMIETPEFDARASRVK